MTGFIPSKDDEAAIDRMARWGANAFIEWVEAAYPDFWSKAPDNIEQRLKEYIAHGITEELR